MVIADCSVKNKLGKVRFFQEIFLLANNGLEVVMRMPFLTLSKADIWFTEWQLVWKTYMAAEALPMTTRVEIIDKIEFVAAVLNEENKIFVMYVVALVEPTTMPIYTSCQAQVVALTSKETRIPVEYSDFSNTFSLDSATKLPEHIEINDHPINLLDNK